jgi:hypothetical protein
MIRLLYWLIKRRWAVCKECKYYYDHVGINKCSNHKNQYWSKSEYITGEKGHWENDWCSNHNRDGCCWGFKPKDERIEPPEPWPRY